MEFNNILNNQNQLTKKYKSYISSVEETTNRIIKKYREVNSHNRTDTSPNYFESTWNFNEYLAWVLDDSNATADFQKKLMLVYKNIENIQKEISIEIEQTRDILQPIDKILASN